MAPREATGNFPDQLLTFDYEAAMPLGLPPAAHDPMPPLPAENGAAADTEDGNPADALNHVTSGTSGASEALQSALGNVSDIDPLSIDPTEEHTAIWEAATAEGSQIAGPTLPQLSMESLGITHPPSSSASSTTVPQVGAPTTVTSVNRAVSLGSTDEPTGSINMHMHANMHSIGSSRSSSSHGNVNMNVTMAMAMMHGGDNSNAVSGSSPLSTGSSLLNASTAPNSPQNSLLFGMAPQQHQTSGPSFSDVASASASVAASVSSHRYRGRPLQVNSVLDNSTSLDSDDEDAPPGLDITYDSTGSGSTMSQAAEDWDIGQSHLVEDDNETDYTPSLPVTPSHSMGIESMRSGGSFQLIHQNAAFDLSVEDDPSTPQAVSPTNGVGPNNATSPSSILLSFGPNTSVADLKYFAERGCIVALLQALTTPRLVTLGTRMLADYAKMSHRRVAVASNKRILEFVQRTMLQASEHGDWLGREYAVETVRSLTATEESDQFLMSTPGLLNTLALVARGGPFAAQMEANGACRTMPLASDKARLHACIAIMNLSCGKANKIAIARVGDVLEAMRDVMLNGSDEARLKATTCIKNLSNADVNDAALLETPGLVEALGHVAATTCSPKHGATPCTTNACLALMNLSISKANKHRVFRTAGVMDSLMCVLERTTSQGSSTEARIKACSALSNLAIGYDNKIPMFNYPGFVDSILNVIQTDTGEARTKACSILWSFAAEMKNQVPVVMRGDILPVLVRVAQEDGTTEARFKCVAALTLLAESLDNAIPLLESGALAPLMDILHDAGADPTQWKGQTASWCVGFLMNIAQSDEAVPALREAGVVELLAPLLTLDHYQSLKAAMAVTFVCRFDEGDECYDLLRKTENVIPKIISLLHNTLSGRGGNGYKYGVFTLRSSVGCIAALASGPDFMKERIATKPVFESLLRVVSDYCVDGGTPGAIVGGGRDDTLSATLAMRAMHSLTCHLIPVAGSSALPFGDSMESRLLTALASFEDCATNDLKSETRALATDARIRIQGGREATKATMSRCTTIGDGTGDVDMNDVASLASNCCGLESIPGLGEEFLHALALPSHSVKSPSPTTIVSNSSMVEEPDQKPVRTFLLTDTATGRRFVVPTDPSGGRTFNDSRIWCYRRGRFCFPGESPDNNFVWTPELQAAYEAALRYQQDSNRSEGNIVTTATN
mmetsp:Transcript_22877/g.64791  ORF Transcript_22877/g.64791 Transcript_22877/m.64791 type:complete len:1188 (-) Transcript_22877:148-3711(-)|eukprot:CAMPEP_0119560566 /NCGR_PEP_ID=MMETSP1352-20130426/15235_1 /TAXON_ID=265584 /ORGANISM="Stauroneis constricta, Strain CCMP1120" /LENGTH=1187 /DNA_ID=CAMNT_0007608571 /DNA_START=93 /DNA_END=3656 /DNA_ORIENTATION=+